MIITGNFYQSSTAEQSKTSSSSEVDNLKALRTFFQESDKTESKGFSDKVQISAQALSVLREYVGENGLTEDDPMAELIKKNSLEKYFGSSYSTTGTEEETESSAMDELSEMVKAFGDKQISEIYAQIKEANQQLSGDFISAAARHGVQSLL